MLFGFDIAGFAIASVVVPFVAAILIIVCKQAAAKWLSLGAGSLSFFATALVWIGFAGIEAERVHSGLISLGKVEVLGLVFDQISVMLASCFVVIGLIITVYSIGYLSSKNREHADAPRRSFYVFFTLFIGAMAGLVYSSTLVGQLVFFEITGACSWALIRYYGTKTANRAALKALILTHVGTLGLFLAIGILFFQTGSLGIGAIALLDDHWKTVLLLCVLFAAWAKSAQLPFYMWLPSAMEAPTPVSAYLHGASMVKAGVAVFARVLTEAGAIPEIIGWVAAIAAVITLLFSFFMYLPQRDLKRLLAFSTISQLSYIFLGFAFFILGSSLAFEGALMHIFNHAFAKTLFFLVAGALSFTLGTRLLPHIKGVLKKQPLLGVGFAVGALAIAGVPPLNGFFSKFAIFSGSFQAAAGDFLLMTIVVVALVETVVCFAWFVKWIGSVLPGEPSEVVASATPLPKSMSFTLVLLIIMVFVSSFIAAAWLG
ncbi:MAG: hydrogenase 4 subunit D [Coriobacteriia bacterium]|nr:hydrogenase 4 subunit D [Coriobacteriia bacterium]